MYIYLYTGAIILVYYVHSQAPPPPKHTHIHTHYLREMTLISRVKSTDVSTRNVISKHILAIYER